MIYIQILIYLLSAILGCMFFIKSKFKYVYVIICSTFITLQLASIYSIDGLINHQFYIHMNIDGVKMFGDQFIYEFLIGVLLIGILSFLILKISTLLNKLNIKKIYAGILIIVLMSFTFIEGGGSRNLYDILSQNNIEDVSFTKALKDLGMENYVFKDQIKATKGKNIIIISLESFEKGFIDTYPHLTPNLNKLKKEYAYYNMNQGRGSAWTSGSLYTYMTGVPMLFKGIHGNEVLQGAENIELSGLGDVLYKTGYKQSYLLGNPKFSGMKDIIESYNIEVKSELSFKDKYPKLGVGLHDYDLFKELKKEVLSKKDHDPFAIYASTISTHFPRGIYDERVKQYVDQKTNSDLELMVAAVDKMVGEFISFLKKEHLLENTVFYIFPDHTMMGGNSLIEKFNTRELFLLTNATKKNTGIKENVTLEQLDLPKIILEGANIAHNVKFLTDYIPSTDRRYFVKNNEEKIIKLNEAALDRSEFYGNIDIELDKGKLELISSNGNEYSTEGIVSKDNSIVFEFDSLNRIKEYNLPSKNASKRKMNSDNINILVEKEKKSDYYISYLRKGNKIGHILRDNKEFNFEEQVIEIIKNSKEDKSHEVDKKDKVDFDERIVTNLESRSFGKGASFIERENKKMHLNRGINIISESKDELIIKNYDPYIDSLIFDTLIDDLKKLKKQKSLFLIVVHDSGAKNIEKYRKELKEMDLFQLSNLKVREAYIGYCFNGIIGEQRRKNKVSFSFDDTFFKSISSKKIDQRKKEIDRFIAHAGGKIGDDIYSNSLEALNKSYKNGVRYFELDINRTSDSVLVAIHDWEHWKKITDFQGQIPPSLEVFKKQKIYGKWTCLDISDINDWFTKHKDAIFVTDKINEPKKFLSEIEFERERVLMELFSLKAIKEANDLGASFLMTQRVLGNIKGDKVKKLKELNVDKIAISLPFLLKNEELVLKLKEHNIRAYIYLLGREPWKDENYMMLKGMDVAYGIYADDYYFINKNNE